MASREDPPVVASVGLLAAAREVLGASEAPTPAAAPAKAATLEAPGVPTPQGLEGRQEASAAPTPEASRVLALDQASAALLVQPLAPPLAPPQPPAGPMATLKPPTPPDPPPPQDSTTGPTPSPHSLPSTFLSSVYSLLPLPSPLLYMSFSFSSSSPSCVCLAPHFLVITLTWPRISVKRNLRAK